MPQFYGGACPQTPQESLTAPEELQPPTSELIETPDSGTEVVLGDCLQLDEIFPNNWS